MARATTSERQRLNGGAGRGEPREVHVDCPRCGLSDCAACAERDERDEELGDVVEDMAAELGEIRAGQVELVTLLRELVTLARGSRFRRVPASEVAAAVAAAAEPEDDDHRDDEPDDDDEPEDDHQDDDEQDHEHLAALRTGTGMGAVHVADPEAAPGRDVPSVLLSDLRAVEAARAPAPAGGDAFDQLTELVMVALDARWATRDALQRVLRAASRVQRQSPAGDARALLTATLPQLAPGGQAQAAARAMLNAAE